MPVHLREDVVQESEDAFLPQYSCAEAMPYVTLLTHHRFWMQATWYFQSFGSTFMRLWALVTSALRMMKVSPCVGGCHVRGSHLPPPRRSVPGGVGGMGPSYQGPRHLGVAPSLRMSTTERRPGRRRVSIIPLPLSGPSALGGGLVLWGSLSGPSAPGDCPCPGFSSVPEDGPPLS